MAHGKLRLPSINHVAISGNLTRDPDLRYISSGNAVCQLSVAVTKRWKRKDSDEWEERTAFVGVATWGRLAENCGERLRKGDPVYVFGEVAQEKPWEDRDGNKREGRVHINVAQGGTVQRLDKDEDGGGGRSSSRQSSGDRGRGSAAKSSDRRDNYSGSSRRAEEAYDEVPEDDIPF